MDVYCFECPDHCVAVIDLDSKYFTSILFTSMITVTLYISNVVIVFMILLCVSIYSNKNKTSNVITRQNITALLVTYCIISIINSRAGESWLRGVGDD